MLQSLLTPLLQPLLRPPLEVSGGSGLALYLDFLTEYIDPRITYSGGANGTRVNSAGLIVAATTPRFDYNPVTLAPLGLLVEEARTRLNTIAAAPTLPEIVTTAATPYTLSFYGTGAITLTGTSTAGPLVGTGAYPNRVTLTFTPTAGPLTLTPSGSVTDLQLEAGSFATSVIRGEGTTVTRSADSAVMTGTNFSSWFNEAEGTMVVGYSEYALTATDRYIAEIYADASNKTLSVRTNNTTVLGFTRTAGAFVGDVSSGTVTVNAATNAAYAYKANDVGLCVNGGAVASDVTVSPLPTSQTTLGIGAFSSGTSQLNGHVRSIRFYASRLPNSTLQGMTA